MNTRGSELKPSSTLTFIGRLDSFKKVSTFTVEKDQVITQSLGVIPLSFPRSLYKYKVIIWYCFHKDYDLGR